MRILPLAAATTLCIALATAEAATATPTPDVDDSPIPNLQTASNTVSFQGSEFFLLDTLTNPDEALSHYAARYAAELGRVQTNASLPELSVYTAGHYKQLLIMQDDSSATDLLPLLQFLDLYENPADNAQILEQLENFEAQVASGELTSSEALTLARMWLPTREENGNTGAGVSVRNSGINLAAARAYAQRWATSYHPTYGAARNGWNVVADCTNFASQILLAGGVSMDRYSNEAWGWWWTRQGNHSISWVNANVFKNYMGSGYTTQNWNSFVANVRDGDFIAVDTTNDGTVDHMGFVHTKSGGRLYIAQHTTNYLNWNGNWPKYSGTGRYYRVRR